MRFLLDTNICIYIAKKKPANVLRRFEGLKPDQVCMSTITYGELLYGAHKSEHPKKTLKILEELASFIPVIAISIETDLHYGRIRSCLEKQGLPIGNNDLWIAAHALDLNVVLVTNNVKEFSRIPDLKLENWAE